MQLISSYAVSNFKAIGKRTEVQLSPLTLLFGENSSGKSSLFQSLLLLRHYLRTGEFDAHQLGRGSSVDLGGRSEYAHHGRVDQPTTWELRWHGSPIDYTAVESLPFANDMALTVRVSVQGPNENDSVERIDISDDDGPILSLVMRGHPEYRERDFQFWDHPSTRRMISFMMTVLSNKGIAPAVDEESLRRLLNGAIGFMLSPTDLFSDATRRTFRIPVRSSRRGPLMAFAALQAHRESSEYRDAMQVVIDLVTSRHGSNDDAQLLEELDSVCLWLQDQKDTNAPDDDLLQALLAHWDKNRLDEQICPVPDLEMLARHADILDDDIEMIVSEYFTVAANLLKLASLCLSDLHHLGPLRVVPPRTGVAHASWQAQEGDALGESDWHRMLGSIGPINEWLGPGFLDAGLEVRPRKLFDEPSLRIALENMRASPSADVSEILEGMEAAHTAVVLRDTMRDRDVNVVDVGIGIAQVLPVLARALDERSWIHLIEQPELHLHPRLQAELADAFIAGVKDEAIVPTDDCDRFKLNDNLVRVVETHSEHFILRILRRIRETFEERVPERLALSPNDVAVYYALPGDNGTQFVRIELSPDGGFMSPWPKGFFPERMWELA